MLLLSVGSGITGLSVYRTQREADARRFANVALKRIFTQHDTYFLLDHVNEKSLRENSRLGLTRFLQDATMRAGDVHDIQPAVGRLQCWYGFPLKLVSFGVMRAEGSGMHGPVEMQLKVIEAEMTGRSIRSRGFIPNYSEGLQSTATDCAFYILQADEIAPGGANRLI